MAGIGLSLMAMGALFVSYLWGSYKRATKMDSWVETPCIIEKSELAEAGLTQHYAPKFEPNVSYQYTFDGQEFTGDKIQRLKKGSPDKKKIERLVEKYPIGEATCYVDPKDPKVAVLKKDTKAALYSIWFPSLFFLGGLGILLSQFRRG